MLEDPHYVVHPNQTIDDTKKQSNMLKQKGKCFFTLVFLIINFVIFKICQKNILIFNMDDTANFRLEFYRSKNIV